MMKQTSKHKSRRFRRFLKAKEAVSALEYAILVGVIAIAVGAAIFSFSGDLSSAITAIGTEVTDIKVDGAGQVNPAPTP